MFKVRTIGFSCFETIGIGIYDSKAVTKFVMTTRPHITLLSWLLPERSNLKLESIYFYDDKHIDVMLLADDVFITGEIKNSCFIPTDHMDFYAEDHGSDLLARTIMFNSRVSIFDGGPDYYQTKNDKFWLNFIDESWNLSLIAAIQNT